jgi:glycosyltransferase involved in cell wall biosynthesis
MVRAGGRAVDPRQSQRTHPEFRRGLSPRIDALVRRPLLGPSEEEYRLAGRVRVSSTLAKSSMEAGGVPGTKISILPQPIDTARFSPPSMPRSTSGPIRLCFVGSLDLRKGFVYLLRAMRMLGREAASLEIVGATGNRTCRMLFAREREGLEVINAPGDPVPALRRAELFVFPTLEDGRPW